MQDRIAVHNTQNVMRKLKVSDSITSLQPRFGTVGLLVVLNIEGDVERSTFFNGYRNSGSRAQMKPESLYMDKMKKWIERLNKCLTVSGGYVEK
ncbi:hypothetical protein TNCV_691181 [Trichonephila clavipes]|nr:hypothetical protein TNCV_691181 [Trichonephila clavipes]